MAAWLLLFALASPPAPSGLPPSGGEVPATPSTDEAMFQAGAAALERGDIDAALDRFEQLADRGFVHPDASFDRALAYLQRARSRQAESGDLGRAAAALVETTLLRPSDVEAARALERVREEIANRRVRGGLEPAVVAPSLARASVGVLSEGAWIGLALAGSTLLSVGLIARRVVSHRLAVLIGTVVALLGAGLLGGGASGALAAGYYRRSSMPAVVVVPEARVLDERGAPLEVRGRARPSAIPEGAGVYVLERRGALARVEWGTTRVWVQGSSLRVLARP